MRQRDSAGVSERGEIDASRALKEAQTNTQ